MKKIILPLILTALYSCKQKEVLVSAPTPTMDFDEILRAAAVIEAGERRQQWDLGYSFRVDSTTFDITEADSTKEGLLDLEFVADPRPNVHYFMKFSVEQLDSTYYQVTTTLCSFGDDKERDNRSGPCQGAVAPMPWNEVEKIFHNKFEAILVYAEKYK